MAEPLMWSQLVQRVLWPSVLMIWLMRAAAEGSASPKDLPSGYIYNCNSTAGSYFFDAMAYYEKGNIAGFWVDDLYWEMKFLHGNRYPLLHKDNMLAENVWITNCMKNETIASPNCFKPGRHGFPPKVDAVHSVDGKVYILFAPGYQSEVNKTAQRYIYEFNYNPPTTSMPTFVRSYRPEEYFPMFNPLTFNEVQLSATMITVNPVIPSQRVLWTNTRTQISSLKAWTPDRQTQGGAPTFSYTLKGPDGKAARQNLIWAMDTFHTQLNNTSNQTTSYILNFRRYKHIKLVDVAYAVHYQLKTAENSDGWIFDRTPHLIWDVNIVGGCPQSFCFDATLDGGIADRANATHWRVILFRGPYIFELTHPDPAYLMPYPISSHRVGVRNNVKSLRDVITNPDEYLIDAQWPVDATLQITSQDNSSAMVYLIKGSYWFLYLQDKDHKFYDQPLSHGRLSDLLAGYSFEKDTIIDAAWYSTAERRLYLFSGSNILGCSLKEDNSAERKPHKFGSCGSVKRPTGWRPQVDATLTYPGQGKSLFTHVSFAWYVKDDGSWQSAEYKPFFVHALQNNPHAIYYDPSNWCNYTSTYEHLKTDEIWKFLFDYQKSNGTNDIEDTITPDEKTKEGGELDAATAILWVVLLVICISIIVGLIFWQQRQKKKDEYDSFSSLATRASMRSKMSAVGHTDDGEGPRAGSGVFQTTGSGTY